MLKLYNFDSIVAQANEHISSLSESRQQELKENLNHGKALLKSNDELKAYLHFYGDIHRQKLLLAYSELPKNLRNCPISIIDWGCGQGIASLVFNDYIDHDQSLKITVSDVTLIEPSLKSLMQAESYINWSMPKALSSTIHKREHEVDKNDILVQESTVVHLLSNIVDIPEFSGTGIVSYIESTRKYRHVIVCVSPFYPEDGRGKRMDEFGELLPSFKCVHTFEKHIDDWAKDFSCQIRIYDNA